MKTVDAHLQITQLIFNNGTSVDVPPRGTVVLVGPNNAGKSATLLDTCGYLETLKGGSVLREARFSTSGTATDFRAWLDKFCLLDFDLNPEYGRGDRKLSRYSVSPHDLLRWENPHEKGLGKFAKLVSILLRAEDRLRAAQSTDAHDPRTEVPQQPVQQLLRDENLERDLRAHCRRSFGAEFIVCRGPGRKIYVHWGDEPASAGDRSSQGYLDALGGLPLLDAQGDGVRSFLGTLFHLSLASEFVVMIDEPEAFLHPPQARQLGTLVGEFSKDRQVLLATHSIDILRGLMDVDNLNLVIVHLRRSGSTNSARVLKAPDIAKAWADPILRYGNILDGLFHDMLILGESEVDCRFYNAALDHFKKLDVENTTAQPDVLFAHVGGKSGFPRAVDASLAFGVPVHVIADFDVLNSKDPIARIVSALGADWADFLSRWKLVNTAVQKLGVTPPNIAELRASLETALKEHQGTALDKQLATRLESIVSYPTTWSRVKKTGLQAIPRGQERAAAEQLLRDLATIGLFVVPVGEVECWVPTIGDKSMGWLTEVFKTAREAPSNVYTPELLDFLTQALASNNPPRHLGPRASRRQIDAPLPVIAEPEHFVSGDKSAATQIIEIPRGEDHSGSSSTDKSVPSHKPPRFLLMLLALSVLALVFVLVFSAWSR